MCLSPITGFRIVSIQSSYIIWRHRLPLSPPHVLTSHMSQAGDDFTAELVRIHEIIEAEGGPRQTVYLAINRSDYMLHDPQDGETTPHLLQVSQS